MKQSAVEIRRSLQGSRSQSGSARGQRPLHVAVLATGDPFREAREDPLRLWSLSRLLKSHGVRVAFHAVQRLRSGAPDGEDLRIEDGLPIRGVSRLDWWRHPVPRGALWNPMQALPGILAEKPDAVLMAGARSLPTALIAGALGLPVVMDLSSQPEEQARDRIATGRTRSWVKVACHFAAREPEGILVSSEDVRGILIRRHGAHPGRVVTIGEDSPAGPRIRKLGDALVWVAPLEPKEALADLRSFEMDVLAPLKRARPRTRILVVLPEELGRVSVRGAECRFGLAGLASALDQARLLIQWGAFASRRSMLAALRRGIPACGLPGIAKEAGGGVEGMRIGVTAAAIIRCAGELLDDEQQAMLLGHAGLRGLEECASEHASMDPVLALLHRARRAWIDPLQKLDVLARLPGRWPASPDRVLAWIGERRFLGLRLGTR